MHTFELLAINEELSCGVDSTLWCWKISPLFGSICREAHFWYMVPDEVNDESLLDQYSELLSSCERDNVFGMKDKRLWKGALLARALLRTTLSRCTAFQLFLFIFSCILSVTIAFSNFCSVKAIHLTSSESKHFIIWWGSFTLLISLFSASLASGIIPQIL